SPPSAPVAAVGESVVLALPKAVLQRRLADDMPFAARFYRALAIFLADRLRTTTRRLGYGQPGDGDDEASAADELDHGVLDTFAGRRALHAPAAHAGHCIAGLKPHRGRPATPSRLTPAAGDGMVRRSNRRAALSPPASAGNHHGCHCCFRRPS